MTTQATPKPTQQTLTPPPPPFAAALVGNPNCGKTALFNALTGGRAKVSNYPGVTVEKKSGLLLPARRFGDSHKSSTGPIELIDLPGTYSLHAQTLDEQITQNVLLGVEALTPRLAVVIAVVDAVQLERGLGLILELKKLQELQAPLTLPLILVISRMDLAKQAGFTLDLELLARRLELPLFALSAQQQEGLLPLVLELERRWQQSAIARLKPDAQPLPPTPHHPSSPLHPVPAPDARSIAGRFQEVDALLQGAVRVPATRFALTDRLDRVVLHPLWGSLLLLLMTGVIFQLIFIWAAWPMDLLKEAFEGLGRLITAGLGPGPLQSLLVDGMLGGVGAVLIFLPQILLLFAFIYCLEDSGYMARAAFLMDRLMGKMGIHGKAFIPLFSSFACAIPGMMATRTIENPKDRLITLLIAPLMTCSARLPVYALLIGTFIPHRKVAGFLELQGLVLFCLYLIGILSALLMARLLKSTLLKGEKAILLMELPQYQWPNVRNLGVSLLERARLFLERAGTLILAASVLLWFLVTYPRHPELTQEASLGQSYAGQLGHLLEPWFLPIGFNWKIAMALIPGFLAREMMISALGTIYAVAATAPTSPLAKVTLSETLAQQWSLATALSLMVWYIFACQCLSTLVVARRETQSWVWPAFIFSYMTVLAYGASWCTYHLALVCGWG